MVSVTVMPTAAGCGGHPARDAGVDTSLPTAVLDFFRRGAAVGHADDSATSLIEVLKKPAA
ncbi:hypothetical protein ACFWXA_34520 [Streptomyces atroolivaceus]|uniref:imine reductase family protein n=1 Tax=Streptomyces atroolivaceus TaxID=66869 RepID=UPI003668A040